MTSWPQKRASRFYLPTRSFSPLPITVCKVMDSDTIGFQALILRLILFIITNEIVQKVDDNNSE